MKLTELEIDCLKAMYESEYHGGCIDEKPQIWSFSVAENTKITKPNQVSGVLSSLSKKGLINCFDYEPGEPTVSVISDEVHAMAVAEDWGGYTS